MKHRVKEKNGKFYPQEKEFLFWDNFVDTRRELYGNCNDPDTYEEVYFYTDLETNKTKYYYDTKN